MVRNLLAVLTALAAPTWASAQVAVEPPPTRIYVSPSGSDANAGTFGQPFRTLTRARDQIRSIKAANQAGGVPAPHLTTDIVVEIRGGVYHTSDGDAHTGNLLALEAQDSGSADHEIRWRSYPGERAIVHGGERLLNWRGLHIAGSPGNEYRWWTTTVPWIDPDGPEENEFEFPRDLYVNNQRMIRARHPNLTVDPVTGLVSPSSFFEIGTVDTPGALWITLPNAYFPLESPVFGYWNTGVFQAVAMRTWTAPRQQVDDAIINVVQGGTLTTTILFEHKFGITGPNGNGGDLKTIKPGDLVYFEGTKEFCNAPYEWYYHPPTGEVWVLLPWNSTTMLDPNANAAVVAPKSQVLAQLHYVDHVRLENLDFGFTNFVLPPPSNTDLPPDSTGWYSNGYGFEHGAPDTTPYPLRPAVELRRTNNCFVTKCRIAHTGASGLSLEEGTGNTINVNEVFDTGGTGIYVGPWWMWGTNSPQGDDGYPKWIPVNNSVRENYVHDVGQVFHDAVGIKVVRSRQLTILRNHVRSTPATAIHVGLSGPYRCVRNWNLFVESNLVERATMLLNDTGGIGTVNGCHTCAIRYNCIREIYEDQLYASRLSRRGLMMDGTGMGYVVSDNVIYDMFGCAMTLGDGMLTTGENCLDLAPLCTSIWEYGQPPLIFANVYQQTNYLEEGEDASLWHDSPPGTPACCRPDGTTCTSGDPLYCSGGLPPHAQVHPRSYLATTLDQPIRLLRDTAGPSATYDAFLYCNACDAHVHPY